MDAFTVSLALDEVTQKFDRLYMPESDKARSFEREYGMETGGKFCPPFCHTHLCPRRFVIRIALNIVQFTTNRLDRVQRLRSLPARTGPILYVSTNGSAWVIAARTAVDGFMGLSMAMRATGDILAMGP